MCACMQMPGRGARSRALARGRGGRTRHLQHDSHRLRQWVLVATDPAPSTLVRDVVGLSRLLIPLFPFVNHDVLALLLVDKHELHCGRLLLRHGAALHRHLAHLRDELVELGRLA